MFTLTFGMLPMERLLRRAILHKCLRGPFKFLTVGFPLPFSVRILNIFAYRGMDRRKIREVLHVRVDFYRQKATTQESISRFFTSRHKARCDLPGPVGGARAASVQVMLPSPNAGRICAAARRAQP